MNLALFDLDHTLIPFDSGMAWTQFLVSVGALPAEAEARYLECCQHFVAGKLDIHAMHRTGMAVLAGVPAPLRAQWGREFELRMAARVPMAMRVIVRKHLDSGDLCAIVTATSRLIAEPFARLFGVRHLLATEAATADGSPQGTLTGEIAGLPCHREHKVTRVGHWLAGCRPQQAGGLAAFDRSWFYSDSASDLPLLEAVSHPVAVRPDRRLHAHALREGWPIIG
jgi:HAD superfamily hydrolase (TIGR01490 family)